MDLGALLSAGTGLLSAGASLFGPKPLSQRKAIGLEYDYQQKTAQDMPALQVEGWQKAGLNPAMMATSSGNMMTQGPQVGPASYDGSMAGLSSGLQTFADAVSGMQQVGPDAKKRETLETQILEKRLEVLNRGLQTKPETGLRMESRVNEPGMDGLMPTEWETGTTTVTNPWPEAKVSANTADAEAIETRYGDVVSSAYGGWVGAKDLAKNIPKPSGFDFKLGDFGFNYDPNKKPKTTYRTGETF